MLDMLRGLSRMARREDGQTLTEYAILLVVLVTVALIAVLVAYGNSVGRLFGPISNVFN